MKKRYRCDVPMAKKKGILKHCNSDCKDCLCAIKMSDDGSEEHVGLLNEGSPQFMMKNLETIAGRSRE